MTTEELWVNDIAGANVVDPFSSHVAAHKDERALGPDLAGLMAEEVMRIVERCDFLAARIAWVRIGVHVTV